MPTTVSRRNLLWHGIVITHITTGLGGHIYVGFLDEHLVELVLSC
jgi:hypothetical protein